MKANFNGFELTSKNARAKESVWGADKQQHHIITVKYNGKRTSFDFWQSKAHPLIDSERQLISAFACFVDDASYGSYDVDEFFQELGYEKASEGIRAWKGCQSAKRKLDRLYDGDIYELTNSLDDYR